MCKHDDRPPRQKSIFFFGVGLSFWRHLIPKKSPMTEYIPDVRFIIS